MTQEERLSRYQQFKDFQKVIKLRRIEFLGNSKFQGLPECNFLRRLQFLGNHLGLKKARRYFI
jgi:hypothetical protein